MKRQKMAYATTVLVTLMLGCGGGGHDVDEHDTANQTAEQVNGTTATDVDPEDPTLIARPFTAEQIRDEWVPGLRLLMRRTTPGESRVERWTVVSADADGADIEYAVIADDGSLIGQPSIERSTWTELRDHASFPLANATREWVARETGLGTYEGWLYKVTEDGTPTVQEFFFVPELPGAPVQMQILDGDTPVFSLEQTARLRPESE